MFMCCEMDPHHDSSLKMVLVCIGERKRPMSLPQEASLADLKLRIVDAYRDVIPHSSSSTDDAIAASFVLQMKSENWHGEFIDVKSGDEVPDRSVLRVVTTSPQVYFCIYYSIDCMLS